jgi:hypothetical protein
MVGPYGLSQPGVTPSRERVFISRPGTPEEFEACAAQVLSTLIRRAWRRPVNAEDVERVMPFFRETAKEGGFDAGIEAALSAVLVSREFLFRVEQEPKDLEAGKPWRLSAFELASRLSFFLWSSIPDDELLTAAERGELDSSVLPGLAWSCEAESARGKVKP